MESKKNLIEAKGIDLKISKKGALAFGGLNFRINAGEFVIFFGPSGSGKSKLLRIMAGLSKPEKGEILINSKKASFIDSSSNLISTLSVLDNVILPLIFSGISGKIRHKTAVDILKSFGLKEKLYAFPQQISKKEELLVALARALLTNPEIIFLDEAVKKLGLKSSKMILDILYELNKKEKKAIVLTTDDAELFCYAEKIFFLKEGKIIKKGISAKRPELFDVFNRSFLKENNFDFTKALSAYFLSPGEFELKSRVEDLFLKRLENKLSDGSLKDLLKRSPKDGGAGFSEEKAQEALRRTALVGFERNLLKKEQEKESVDIGELRKRILFKYRKKLSVIQIERLEDLLERLLGKIISENYFKKILILPESCGGLGLGLKEAKKITLSALNVFSRLTLLK